VGPARWCRVEIDGGPRTGRAEGERILLYDGDLLDTPVPTGEAMVKQDYPVSDMIFSPQDIVWHISREIALYPGDVIACGTSVGAADMASGQTVVIEIPGVGRLHNTLV